jgi:hypothetical protein
MRKYLQLYLIFIIFCLFCTGCNLSSKQTIKIDHNEESTDFSNEQSGVKENFGSEDIKFGPQDIKFGDEKNQ